MAVATLIDHLKADVETMHRHLSNLAAMQLPIDKSPKLISDDMKRIAGMIADLDPKDTPRGRLLAEKHSAFLRKHKRLEYSVDALHDMAALVGYAMSYCTDHLMWLMHQIRTDTTDVIEAEKNATKRKWDDSDESDSSIDEEATTAGAMLEVLDKTLQAIKARMSRKPEAAEPPKTKQSRREAKRSRKRARHH
jgi:hypothetical protein